MFDFDFCVSPCLLDDFKDFVTMLFVEFCELGCVFFCFYYFLFVTFKAQKNDFIIIVIVIFLFNDDNFGKWVLLICEILGNGGYKFMKFLRLKVKTLSYDSF